MLPRSRKLFVKQKTHTKMRKYFQQQLEFGITPIHKVVLDFQSRHSLVPILRGLQIVFETPSLNKEVFKILDKKIIGDKQNTGRPGMDLWEILVLGTVKLNLNIDYDVLHDLTNEHRALRGILGIQRSDFRDGQKYKLQTLKDNVRLLDESTIYQIVDLIVLHGHDLIKKKEGKDSLDLKIRADSFVVETNIHFPTDINLLWDSVRKCIETIGFLRANQILLTGWREWKDWRKKVRFLYRLAAEVHRKGGANYRERLEECVTSYLEICRELVPKVQQALLELSVAETIMRKMTPTEQTKLEDLKFYFEMLEKHIDLVHRRIILGETIPHDEKVFSIFEAHTEWNSKGKAGKDVEFGHNVLVAFDQYGFALHGEVYEKTVDKSRTIVVGNILQEKYGRGEKLYSISFDKNFYSLPAEQSLGKQFKILHLPKAGRKSKSELEQAGDGAYQEIKKAHGKVEGNINELEQHGLGMCRDKGIVGFKRCVAYGILSLNLTKLGRLVIAEDLKKIKRLKRRELRQVA